MCQGSRAARAFPGGHELALPLAPLRSLLPRLVLGAPSASRSAPRSGPREDDRILHRNATVVLYANVVFDLAALATALHYLADLNIATGGRKLGEGEEVKALFAKTLCNSRDRAGIGTPRDHHDRLVAADDSPERKRPRRHRPLAREASLAGGA